MRAPEAHKEVSQRNCKFIYTHMRSGTHAGNAQFIVHRNSLRSHTRTATRTCARTHRHTPHTTTPRLAARCSVFAYAVRAHGFLCLHAVCGVDLARGVVDRARARVHTEFVISLTLFLRNALLTHAHINKRFTTECECVRVYVCMLLTNMVNCK